MNQRSGSSFLSSVRQRRHDGMRSRLSLGPLRPHRESGLRLKLIDCRGYDADWFRHALAERGIAACIPSKTNRKVPISHDAVRYRQRYKVENMFGKLKDWRRIHTRYDRCAHTFMSATCIAATMSPEPS